MMSPQSLQAAGPRVVPVATCLPVVVLSILMLAWPLPTWGEESPCPTPGEPPVSLRASEGPDGWTLSVDTPLDLAATEILIGLDGAPPSSTGHERALDVYTGKPRARDWVIVPAERVSGGAHRVEIRLVRRDGSVAGPYTVPFDPAAERLAAAKRTLELVGDRIPTFAEHGDTVTWLGFGTFFDLRDSLRELRYSIDDCSLDEKVVFSADPDAEPIAARSRDPRDLTLDRPFVTLPKETTRSACARAVFRDGTLSRVFQARRPAPSFPPAPPPHDSEPEPPPLPCRCFPAPVLPVALEAYDQDGGWTLAFRPPECPPVTELRVGVDDDAPRSLGRRKWVDPRTGAPGAVQEMFFEPGVSDGDRVVQLRVELARPGGSVDGPFPLIFSPREERLAAAKLALARSPRTFVSFAEHGSDRTWLGFHSLFALGSSLREVRYSIDDCSLGRRLIFGSDRPPIAEPPVAPGDLTPDRPFLTLPKETTLSACVQAVFEDGTTSPVLELVRASD